MGYKTLLEQRSMQQKLTRSGISKRAPKYQQRINQRRSAIPRVRRGIYHNSTFWYQKTHSGAKTRSWTKKLHAWSTVAVSAESVTG